ncbi:hypothetical protein KHQ06_31790 [Nocardia tengchongensis]|uniref:Uncharacterized protein n=1 Tax=Nocardia tengchongensis TaxID=2055889 RepID=A0ABX8CMT9_9NOCA|nr:hypothetical protein [Nocardia tengchongensis]QVI20656.1 hypothetical protein KHQ06_31790 [Nocardia tengchongensis]
MGLDYSYEVYVHRDSARALLEAVKASCNPYRDGTTTVEFPDGPVVLPCTSRFTSGTTLRFDPTAADGGSLLNLDLSLLFPADTELLKWVGERGDAPQTDADNGPLCSVGYIYLLVFDASSFLPDHVSFDFMAATTDMSRLFARSASIRTWFANLTLDHGGPLCLLDLEQKGRIAITLGSFDRQLNVDWDGLYL